MAGLNCSKGTGRERPIVPFEAVLLNVLKVKTCLRVRMGKVPHGGKAEYTNTVLAPASGPYVPFVPGPQRRPSDVYISSEYLALFV